MTVRHSPFIIVRHNIEIAHRLWRLPGKCQNIHGHSMWVELQLEAAGVTTEGIAFAHDDHQLDFGGVKRIFREHLDQHYDHKLLLHAEDPFAKSLYRLSEDDNGTQDTFIASEGLGKLPGLIDTAEDPTTENIADWLATWAAWIFKCDALVRVNETHVNAVVAVAYWRDNDSKSL